MSAFDCPSSVILPARRRQWGAANDPMRSQAIGAKDVHHQSEALVMLADAHAPMACKRGRGDVRVMHTHAARRG